MAIIAREAGVSYRDYVLDYRNLVKGQLICAEKYGVDSVGVISESRETAAYGSNVIYPEDASPYADPLLIDDSFDLSKVIRFDPLESPRTLDRIKAVAQFKTRSSGQYPVGGWVEGVLAETADLRGVNNLLVDLMDGTQGMKEVMDRVFEFQCLFARRQVEAGADIIGIGNAVASLIGPALYEEYALDYDIRLTRYIQGLGALVKLHICGNITPLLELLRQVAPDILDIDWMVDFRRAVSLFEDTKTAVCGNVDPVAVLLQGSPDTVRSMVGACLDAAGCRTMIAAGCEVPAMTPPENLLAMDAMLRVRPAAVS